ncbi:MAG: hypothetical protein QXR69_02030 [Conexivisphaerales archaeon]
MSTSKEKEVYLLIKRLCLRFGCTDAQGTILAYLIYNQQPKSIEDLVKATGLSRTSVSTALGPLESRYLVIKEKRGRIGYYNSSVDFVKMLADQPRRVLEEEIRPLISFVEESYKSARKEEEKRRYSVLLNSLKSSASTLEKIIDCIRANS